MQDNSNFFDLLQYSEIPKLNGYNRDNALREIEYYMNFSNIEAYDIINYERLIYIELQFINDKEIQERLMELKRLISNNFVFKEQILARLQLKS